MAIKLVISGCCGRMGRRIAQLALEKSEFSIAAAFEAPGHEAIGRDLGMALGGAQALGIAVGNNPQAAMSQGEVVIEFTTPDVTIAHAQLAQQLGKPMVIGTTGLSEAQLSTLRLVANAVPIVFSPNMSPGVNVLFELAQAAAKRLGDDFDVEVIESHHREKKDSPSGTARRLVELLMSARSQRSGTIPVHALRSGDIVGDHTVVLAGPSERLELTHRAHSREVFARGALRAAAFIVRQKPGLYDMTHVLSDHL